MPSALLSPRPPALCTTDPIAVHLIGAGAVGRAFLAQMASRNMRLVGITDSSASLYDADGLDAADLEHFKARGNALAQRPRSAEIPSALAASMFPADVVVDATPTQPRCGAPALSRARAALQSGALALASKDALAFHGPRLLAHAEGRIGLRAVLGGTGHRLWQERHALQSCRAVSLVANASTTAVLTLLEQGADITEGLAAARARGVLEPRSEADLDGTDAAFKLAIVCGLLFGRRIDPLRIPREDLRRVNAEQVRARAREGQTTRLVARGSRTGPLRVGYEELPVDSPLAVPPDRVAYVYEMNGGARRVHVGAGIGPTRTAQALLEDVAYLANRRQS